MFKPLGDEVNGRFHCDGKEIHCGDVLQLLVDDRHDEWLTFRAELSNHVGASKDDHAWIGLVDYPGSHDGHITLTGRITFNLRPFQIVRWYGARHA